MWYCYHDLMVFPPPLSLLPEVLSPATVTVSESGLTSIKVSWGPLQPESVSSYLVEFSALPTGKLHTLTVSGGQNYTLLRNLHPDTTYLVTVSARHASGQERAMSVKACTQEGRAASTAPLCTEWVSGGKG